MFSALGKLQGNTVVLEDVELPDYDGKTVFVTISPQKISCKGMAAKYANPNLIAHEKNALETALVERYKKC